MELCGVRGHPVHAYVLILDQKVLIHPFILLTPTHPPSSNPISLILLLVYLFFYDWTSKVQRTCWATWRWMDVTLYVVQREASHTVRSATSLCCFPFDKRTSQRVINKLLRDGPLHALYRTIWHVPALYNIFISIFLKKRRVTQSISRKTLHFTCMRRRSQRFPN